MIRSVGYSDQVSQGVLQCRSVRVVHDQESVLLKCQVPRSVRLCYSDQVSQGVLQ